MAHDPSRPLRPRGPLRVLVADDDEVLRSLVASVLRDEGHEVMEASNGRELFWAFETSCYGTPIDVVVSDLCMPAYDGLEVAEAWADRGDGPRVVLMSAYPDADARRRAEALGLVLLDKPFDLEALQRMVRSYGREA
ncbi:hypothetical protein BH09MYX1_BH09MYX1_00260 [soil metagenome]